MPNDFAYLFRYRDLVAPTLDSHRSIISQHGTCWWGWWKRPSEGARTDVWNKLEADISRDGQVKIGLFDSGSGRAVLATVTRVEKPRASNSDDRQCEALQPPSGEEHLVPEYYRGHPFSRAWLKMTHIDSVLVDLFGRYSYAERPVMEGFSVTQLDKFLNKTVSDAIELRTMDTTIWHLRPSSNTDHAGEVLSQQFSVSGPVDAQPISLQSNLILHLSDIHFATGTNRTRYGWKLEKGDNASPGVSTLSGALLNAIGDRNIGLIAVSGDITYVAAESEFDQANTLLYTLFGRFGIGKDNVVVVPGNHDIKWTNDSPYEDESEVAFAPAEATEAYRSFVARLFGFQPNSALSMGRRFILPGGMVLDWCCVNSSALEQGRHFLAGMGRVQGQALADVSNVLGWKRSKCTGLRVLMLHHHLVLTENYEDASEYSKGFGVAIDATRVQREAAEDGVSLVLHGHRHRSFLWRSGVYNLPEQPGSASHLGDLNIIGGGSVGARASGLKNAFNLIEVNPQYVRIEVFLSERQGAFQKVKAYLAPFETVGGARVIGVWRDDN